MRRLRKPKRLRTMHAVSKLYVATHPIMVTLGVGMSVMGLLMFSLPATLGTRSGSSLEAFVPGPFEILWPLLLLAGGVNILIGMLTTRPQAEAAGLVLLTSAFLIEAVAIASARGIGVAFIPVWILLTLSVGCGVRAWLLAWAGTRARRMADGQ